MKVLIVGLPYFSNELAKGLSKLYPEHQFISIDTYYSKSDRLKYLFHIFSADIVHSINGTLGKSKVIELAVKLKKKVVFHWVGTDLITAKDLYDKGMHNPGFITYPVHLTDSPWFVDALKEMEISARFVPLKGFDKAYDAKEFPADFTVLCYIPQNRPEFYGIELLRQIAEQLPDVRFNLVGIDSYKEMLPPNMHLNGWVDNMQEWIQNSVVCLRLPKSDGLSFFVLESLAMQRYVAYNKDFIYSDYCNFAEDFVNYIEQKKSLFDANKLELNSHVAKELLQEFSVEKVMAEIMGLYKEVLR